MIDINCVYTVYYAIYKENTHPKFEIFQDGVLKVTFPYKDNLLYFRSVKLFLVSSSFLSRYLWPYSFHYKNSNLFIHPRL